MIKRYVNVLDFVFDIAYLVTERGLHAEYRQTPSSFHVQEVLDRGVLAEGGEYAVLEVRKKGLDTYEALRIMSKEAGIPLQNFLVLGLKDKDSTSVQYVFVKRSLLPENFSVEKGGVEARVVGFSRGKPGKSALLGNRFKIRFEDSHESDHQLAKEILKLVVEHGLPNYYGYQRFGVKRPVTHLLGKAVLEADSAFFAKTLLSDTTPLESEKSVLSRTLMKFDDALLYEKMCYGMPPLEDCGLALNKRLRNLYVDAYVSYLFNRLLTRLIDSNKGSLPDTKIPTLGCDRMAYQQLLSEEKLEPRNWGLVKCWYRDSVIRPADPSVSREGNTLEISFTLPRAGYATIVIRELFKENFLVQQDR
ncbi:tRNA pseudouridine(13) synthase TruD [Thermogladius sp. KZ2Tp1]|uniref:tRNA pseudouridine(13) synthase TruD n=1 Tax=Thermogladius sp. KZ2Tp1 TaxID=3136289 RepID=UPI003DA8F19E